MHGVCQHCKLEEGEASQSPWFEGLDILAKPVGGIDKVLPKKLVLDLRVVYVVEVGGQRFRKEVGRKG